LPEYSIIATAGDEHEQLFKVQCTVEGLAQPTVGEGPNRRKAEQAAARKALESLTRHEQGGDNSDPD
jgi:ribonuclease-3